MTVQGRIEWWAEVRESVWTVGYGERVWPKDELKVEDQQQIKTRDASYGIMNRDMPTHCHF